MNFISKLFLFIIIVTAPTKVTAYAKPKPQLSTASTGQYVVQLETINPTIETFATAIAQNHYPLVSKVSAKVVDPQNNFIPGKKLNPNSLIVALDDKELRYAYYAQKSTFIKLITQLLADFKVQFPARLAVWQTFLSNYSIEAPLPKLPSNLSNKEKNYLSAKNIYNTYYSLKQTEIQLKNYIFIAPFKGSVMTPRVAHQDFVQAGQTIGFFIGDKTYKADILIPLHQRSKLSIGNAVVLTHELTGIIVNTTIKSLSQNLDPQSRTITAYLEFESNQNCHNLVFDATIYANKMTNVAKLPRQLLRDNTVYIQSTDGIKPKKVQVLHVEANDVLVQGLNQSDIVVAP